MLDFENTLPEIRYDQVTLGVLANPDGESLLFTGIRCCQPNFLRDRLRISIFVFGRHGGPSVGSC